MCGQGFVAVNVVCVRKRRQSSWGPWKMAHGRQTSTETTAGRGGATKTSQQSETNIRRHRKITDRRQRVPPHLHLHLHLHRRRILHSHTQHHTHAKRLYLVAREVGKEAFFFGPAVVQPVRVSDHLLQGVPAAFATSTSGHARADKTVYPFRKKPTPTQKSVFEGPKDANARLTRRRPPGERNNITVPLTVPLNRGKRPPSPPPPTPRPLTS